MLNTKIAPKNGMKTIVSSRNDLSEKIDELTPFIKDNTDNKIETEKKVTLEKKSERKNDNGSHPPESLRPLSTHKEKEDNEQKSEYVMDDMIIIKHSSYKFMFYSNTSVIGSFTIPQLLKFINRKYDHILPSVKTDVSYDIIRKFVCTTIDTSTGTEIKLASHIESSFMGNIEMVIKLYFDTTNFLNLSNDEEIVSLKNDNLAMCNVKQIQYLLLNKILKLETYISDVIKDDPAKQELKQKLLRYGVGAVYKIAGMARDDINKKSNEIQILQNDLIKLSKIKLTMYEKMKQLQDNIDSQTKYFESLIMKGGNDTTSDIMSSLESNDTSLTPSTTTSLATTSLTTSLATSSTPLTTTTKSESKKSTSQSIELLSGMSGTSTQNFRDKYSETSVFDSSSKKTSENTTSFKKKIKSTTDSDNNTNTDTNTETTTDSLTSYSKSDKTSEYSENEFPLTTEDSYQEQTDSGLSTESF